MWKRKFLVLKKPGQKQSEESAERERKFVARATVIDSLRRIRLDKHIVTKTRRKAVKQSAIIRRSGAIAVQFALPYQPIASATGRFRVSHANARTPPAADTADADRMPSLAALSRS
jgi:hypothetical protein